MQVLAAHAAIARERRKYSHGKSRNSRQFSRVPVRVPPPAGRPASDPLKTEYRLAGRPPEGWTTSMTLPPATGRMG